jgi:hypothetical protein
MMTPLWEWVLAMMWHKNELRDLGWPCEVRIKPSSPYGVGSVGAKGPELVMHSDNVRGMQFNVMQASYKHVCLSMVKSCDQPRGLGQAQSSTARHQGPRIIHHKLASRTPSSCGPWCSGRWPFPGELYPVSAISCIMIYPCQISQRHHCHLLQLR